MYGGAARASSDTVAAAVSRTPPTRKQEPMPVPTTAKSVTFHSKLTSDYLLAADSSQDLSFGKGNEPAGLALHYMQNMQ